MTTHIIQSNIFYILSGPSASGKSSITRKLVEQGLPADAIVSSDTLRKNILGSFQSMDSDGKKTILYGWELNNMEIFSLIEQILELRFKQRLPTVMDSLALSDANRKDFVKVAQKHGIETRIIIMDVEKEELKHRLSSRAERFPFSVVEKQLEKFQKDSKYPFMVIKPGDEVVLLPQLIPTSKVDVVGDTHGLLDDVVALVASKGWVHDSEKMLWSHPDKERMLVFLGDIVDRGEKSLQLLETVKNTVQAQQAMLLLGNHEAKLIGSYERFCTDGAIVHKSLSASQTLMDFLNLPQTKRDDLWSFLRSCPVRLSLWIDKQTGQATMDASKEVFKIGFCHANNQHFDEHALPKSFALYGGKLNENDTDAQYERNHANGLNTHVLLRGHMPNTSQQNHVYSLEENCAFAGKLLLLDMPQYIASLKANGWQSTHQMLVSATIKQSSDFNFDKYVENKMNILKEMTALVNEGLATDGWKKDQDGKKQVPEDGLKIFKYSKKVHFKRLWDTNPWLAKARGLVLDVAGNIVVHPFDKLYNYGEYDTGKHVQRENRIQAIEKLNGFLGCISKHPFKNELLLSTTGSIAKDAPYVKMIDDFITPEVKGRLLKFFEKNNQTLMFEVIHPEDPHIISYDAKDHGLWLIGARGKKLQDSIESESKLDTIASQLGFRRPAWQEMSFGELLDNLAHSKLEGYMVRDAQTLQPLMKIKTNYYLVTKFVGRMARNMVEMMFNKPEQFKEHKVDEEFYPIVDKIISHTSAMASAHAFSEPLPVVTQGITRQLLNKEFLNHFSSEPASIRGELLQAQLASVHGLNSSGGVALELNNQLLHSMSKLLQARQAQDAPQELMQDESFKESLTRHIQGSIAQAVLHSAQNIFMELPQEKRVELVRQIVDETRNEFSNDTKAAKPAKP